MPRPSFMTLLFALGLLVGCDRHPTVALLPATVDPPGRAAAPNTANADTGIADIADADVRDEACRLARDGAHHQTAHTKRTRLLGRPDVDTKDATGHHMLWAKRLAPTAAGTPCVFVAVHRTPNATRCSSDLVLPVDDRYNACVVWSKGKYMAPPGAGTSSR